MNKELIRSNINEQLTIITTLSRSDLIARWEATFHRPPPQGISRRLLEYSAAYQVQVKALGGLTPTAKRKLQRKAAPDISAAVKVTNPSKLTRLSTGTRLVREWHGKTYTVEVVDDGFQYDGKIYSSLSGVAHSITGARWSGPRFFGL